MKTQLVFYVRQIRC